MLLNPKVLLFLNEIKNQKNQVIEIERVEWKGHRAIGVFFWENVDDAKEDKTEDMDKKKEGLQGKKESKG